MTNYSRGANFERQVRTDLENRGWFVIRAAGSHGIVDLVAFPPNPRPTWFIQCKIGRRISPKERKKLGEIAMSTSCYAILASRPKRGTIRYERYFPIPNQWEEIKP